MSDYDSDDGPPPLEDMSDIEDDDVPDLEEAAVPAQAAARSSRIAAGDEDDSGDEAAAFVQPPPPEDGEAPTLMDEMLSASVAAAKKKREEKAAARKKEDATFGAGLSAKAMFSAPVVVDDGDSGDDDDNSGAGGGVGAGGGASSAAGAGKRPSKQVKRVHKRPANPRMEAKLLAACAKGNMAGVRAALSLQLNLNCRAGNKGGQTPLALAAHGGHLDIVQELLAHDADPNATTKTGKTPLIVATRAGQEEVAVALLAAGAKVKLADSAGKTALDYARAKKRHYLVEALTKRATEEVDEASDVEEEIYLTKPDNAQDPQAGLRLPEVQAAMESSIPQLEKTLKGGEWMTPEFMKKLASNPLLSRGLTNPRFMAAIGEFQSQPEKAKKKYANDKDVRDFMTAFYSLMGEHFTELGKKQEEEERKAKERAAKEAAQAREAARQAAIDSAPDAEVRQALSDPEIMELLSSPRMKAVFEDAAKPGRLRYWLNDAEIGPKLRMLQQRGFVQFQA